MDRIEAACANPAAREELNKLVQDLGIRIGLTFREGRRNNRPVRVLQGGGLHGVGNFSSRSFSAIGVFMVASQNHWRYTCDGDEISPPLRWSGVPEGTKSLALIVDDPDAPDPAAPKRVWVHWVLYDLPPDCNVLAEGLGGPSKAALQKAMQGHVLAETELVGTYKKGRGKAG